MDVKLTRKEITMTLVALHDLTEKYRVYVEQGYVKFRNCPLCAVNLNIQYKRLEDEDYCQYCPHTYLDNLCFSTEPPTCVAGDNFVPLCVLSNNPELAFENYQRINRWIHQLVYMLMETPE